jgi:hypothetical protein
MQIIGSFGSTPWVNSSSSATGSERPGAPGRYRHKLLSVLVHDLVVSISLPAEGPKQRRGQHQPESTKVPSEDQTVSKTLTHGKEMQ